MRIQITWRAPFDLDAPSASTRSALSARLWVANDLTATFGSVRPLAEKICYLIGIEILSEYAQRSGSLAQGCHRRYSPSLVEAELSTGSTARSHADRADLHIAIEDEPRFFAGVWIAAAGQGGHAPMMPLICATGQPLCRLFATHRTTGHDCVNNRS